MAGHPFVMVYQIGFTKKKSLKVGQLNGFHQMANTSLSSALMILLFENTPYNTTWMATNIQCLIRDN
jgi:hypothetical protein